MSREEVDVEPLASRAGTLEDAVALDPALLTEDPLVEPTSPASATTDAAGRFRWAVIVGPLVTLALFLALWEYMHRDGMRRFFDKPGFLVPSPATVFDQSFTDGTVRHQMIAGLGWTSLSAFIGLAISIVLGIGIAVAMARAEWIERSLYPYLVALQAIPVLAIVPLISSIFGGGIGSRILVCVMISLFPIVTNTLFGLTSADPAQHDLFSLRRASRRTRLFKLQFPAAMPAIFTGFRISAGLAVVGAVVGEQFFREGDKPGLGVVVEQFRQKARFPQVYGGLIVIALLGVAVFLAFGLLGRLVVGKWYVSSRRTS
jgi:NitT/TauT family transport system permease protein